MEQSTVNLSTTAYPTAAGVEQPAAGAQATVAVVIDYVGECQSVEVYGSWPASHWQVPGVMQLRGTSAAGLKHFSVTVPVPANKVYEFKFKENGRDWRTSPLYPVLRPVESFNKNNMLFAEATHVASSASEATLTYPPVDVMLRGTADGAFMSDLHLRPGSAGDRAPSAELFGLDPAVQLNAVASAAFHVFLQDVAEGRAARLCWRPQGAAAEQAFEEVDMLVPDLASGHRQATVFRRGGAIEFFFKIKDDRAPGGWAEVRAFGDGGLYTAQQPGVHIAKPGRSARHWRAGSKGAAMVVLDIDGTLYNEKDGSHRDMEMLSAQYKASCALLYGHLVLCTGRAIGDVAALLARHPSLPLVSYVAEAVGTKIWRRVDGRSGHCAGDWEEVPGYRANLDDGSWKLAAVRAAARKVEERHHRNPDQCKVQDDGSEHPHRVSLCMRKEHVAAAVASIGAELQQAGVQHQVVVSGCESHRHVDILPVRAGKEAATQFLRQLAGVPNSRVVAAGDSGNDQSMLSGPHPAIVVGNAQPDLEAWASDYAQDHDSLYCARKGFAAGVEEGLVHFQLL